MEPLPTHIVTPPRRSSRERSRVRRIWAMLPHSNRTDIVQTLSWIDKTKEGVPILVENERGCPDRS